MRAASLPTIAILAAGAAGALSIALLFGDPASTRPRVTQDAAGWSGSAPGFGPDPGGAGARRGEAPAAIDVSARLPPDHGTAEEARSGGVPGAGADPGGQGEELERIMEGMRKLARDLEYTPGLREPLQQTVQPSPEPWRRDETREGPPPVVLSVTPERIRAAGGDRVTIRGRNLRVVGVMFGSAPGRLLAAGDEVVTVEAPPSPPGPVPVAITNEDGTWTIAPAPIVSGD